MSVAPEKSTATLDPDRQQLVAVRARVVERLAEHRENLAGWSEGRYCGWCRGTGHVPYDSDRVCAACLGNKVHDVGYLVPTEPDPDERQAVRRELKAAIAELEPLARMLGIDSP